MIEDARRARVRVFFALVAIASLICAAAMSEEPASIPENPRYVFQIMGAEAGLSTRTANAVLQDSSGFIWIATMDGVYRFDGVEFVLFGESEGLPATYVHQIVEGPDGKIWASVAGRVAWFDGRRFVELDLGRQVELAHTGLDVRQRVAIDANNTVYVSNHREILAINGRRVALRRIWSKRDGMPGDEVRAIHAGSDGKVWFVCGRQVGYIDPVGDRLKMIESIGIPDDAVIAVLIDRLGAIWVRTDNYLVRRAAEGGRFVHDDAGLAEPLSDGIPSLDRHGNILVPTRSGLFVKQAGGWRTVGSKDGLPASAVASATEDRDGALWIGLAGTGLVRWSWRSRWLGWTAEEGLPDNGTWDAYRDEKGRLWVGTNNGVGIWQPKSRTWKVLRREDGLAGYSVWKFAKGPDGRIWSISRRAGLNRYDPETLEPEGVALPDEFDSNPWALEAGPDGTLWVGGKGYLLTIRDGEDG
ncbi:MAG: hypothetical protein JRF63_02225, partial [Deltaproteobacteria bacterium]|nr:hypothetical protein [Deltaproteobacteria bacterium]